MRKQNIATLVLVICLILSGCGQSDNSSNNSELPDVSSADSPAASEEKGVALKAAVEGMSEKLDELKTHSPVNIDWSNAKIGYPLQEISECYAVKLTSGYEVYPDKLMTAEEQLAQFESYCKNYIGEYNSEYGCFDTAERELSNDVYTIDGIEDEQFTTFPKIDEYKEKILNGSVKPAWYLYVDHIRQIYLWWSAETMIYPHWYNKGTTLQMMDKYYKASSALPTDIGEPVAVYLNDGSHNSQSYHLSDGNLTIGEALDWFSNDYMKSLGISEDDIEKLAVRQIEVYQITEEVYAYVFLYTPTVSGIPLDYAGERIFRVSQGETMFKSVTRNGQALMIKSGEIDWAVGVSPEMYITKGEPITTIISLNQAANILSESVSENVLYKATNVELIQTADKNAENLDDLVLVPMWKFTLQNDNDGFMYDFYIDAVSGTLRGYTRFEK